MSDQPLVDQPTWRPTRKIAVGKGGAAISGATVFGLLGYFGVNVDAALAAALSPAITAIWGVVSYFVRDRRTGD